MELNREIKFRAWDKHSKSMVGVGDHKDNWFSITSKGQVIGGGTNYILMQYTGLKDRNGVEIYEGDILKSGVGNWFVSFSGSCFMMVEVGIGSERFIHERVEVIGNIYENPELMEAL